MPKLTQTSLREAIREEFRNVLKEVAEEEDEELELEEDAKGNEEPEEKSKPKPKTKKTPPQLIATGKPAKVVKFDDLTDKEKSIFNRLKQRK